MYFVKGFLQVTLQFIHRALPPPSKTKKTDCEIFYNVFAAQCVMGKTENTDEN